MKNTGEYIRNLFEEHWLDIFIFNSIQEETLTYETFFQRIIAYKEKMECRGIKKGNKICLIIKNSPELLTLYFSSLVMGTVVIPIDPHKGQSEIEDIISQIQGCQIISDSPEINEKYQGIPLEIISGHSTRHSVNKSNLRIFENSDYDALYLITFTSGSTGAPKGVMHSFNNLFLSAIAFKAKFSLDQTSIFYHNLPMSYMAGILNLFVLPFISGSKIVIDERFTVAKILRFWEVPIKYNVNTFWFIPTIVVLLLEMDRNDEAPIHFQKIKSLGFVGTAPMNPDAGIRFQEKYGIHLYPSYGLSETLFVSTAHPPLTHPDETVGEILDGVVITFAEDDEIQITVPWMFKGYYNNDQELIFQDSAFRSGDLGSYVRDRILKITGRKKDLIIRGGVNISPKRIEDFVQKNGYFKECVIMGLKNYSMGEKTGCFYVSESSLSPATLHDINRSITRELGRDYSIDEFLQLDEIPKNLNGKVDKQKILQIISGSPT